MALAKVHTKKGSTNSKRRFRAAVAATEQPTPKPKLRARRAAVKKAATKRRRAEKIED